MFRTSGLAVQSGSVAIRGCSPRRYVQKEMIHKESRNRLAEGLRHYVSGQITNDDLDDIDVDWRDRGAVAVKEMAWNIYEDIGEHKAEGKYHLEKKERKEIARWIVFLHSDREYIWPEYSFLQIVNWPMNILTFGWWEKAKRKKWEQFLEAGDFDVWPFCSKAELKKAINKPRLLRGHRT